MCALLAALEESDSGYIRCASGWLHLRHVIPVASAMNDPVAVAEQLLGAPYLWGGRAGNGLDCSGLVQLAPCLCGVHAPRDRDQQREALGSEVSPDALKRGDLVFFPGHVGFMADDARLIHAKIGRANV